MSKQDPVVRTTFKIDYIKEHISKINEYVKEEKIKGKYDNLDYELGIMDKYPEFYQSYPYLVKKVCRGEDLDMLEIMFKNLEVVESGKESFTNVETKLGQNLANQYLDPVVNKQK
jgi:hypothetical protein